MEIQPPLLLPNGTRQAAFELKADGTVHLLCTDGAVHQVHPRVVQALASYEIAPGVWALAVQAAANGNRIWLPPGVRL